MKTTIAGSDSNKPSGKHNTVCDMFRVFEMHENSRNCGGFAMKGR